MWPWSANCEFSTVIDTSIAVLHWDFALTEGYPDCIGPVEASIKGSSNAVRPFTRYSLAALLWKPYAVSTLKQWSIGQGTMVSRIFFNENRHTRCTLFCCAYEHMVIHGPNMPMCWSGGDKWLSGIWSVAGVFSFHIVAILFYRRCTGD